MFKIWNLVTYQCTMVYELEMACSKYKMVDQLKENEIIFASTVDIFIFDIVKGIITSKIKMHSMPNESISTIMVLNSDNVLVGIDDSWGHNSSSTIRVLNLHRKEFSTLKKKIKESFVLNELMMKLSQLVSLEKCLYGSINFLLFKYN